MNTQIYEQASEWLVKNRESGLDAQDKNRFDGWLRESPQHVRAYLEMSSLWEDVPSLVPSWNPNADELIARAHAEENIVPLEVPGSGISGQPLTREVLHETPDAGAVAPSATVSKLPTSVPFLRRAGETAWVWHHSRRHFAWAASILLAFVGVAAWLYLQRGIYTTGIGEQHSIALNDGSTVELNSRSRVRVRFTDAERAVDLLEGQALFHVAKDHARPFIVLSNGTRVRAVGTKFDVYRKRSGTIVTVLEGRVAVLREEKSTHQAGTVTATPKPPTPAPLVYLGAGEQLTVTATAIAKPTQANIVAAIAWTQHRLVFESSPLTEVAEEFNRYNTRQLIVHDPQLTEFHVSGTFSSADPDLLLRFLRAQPEIVVDETDREIRILRK